MLTTVAYIVAIVVVAALVVFVAWMLALYVIAGEQSQTAWRRYRIDVAIYDFKVRRAHARS